MPCPFNPKNPANRLNVFVSSAQRDEDGFKWGEIRRQVKEHIEECPYLIPFIIDDVAAEMPSTQLFQYKVQKADVVVMLIKGEVRPGTSIEFTVTVKQKKPLLVYFLKSENHSLEVDKLKKAVQETDYCTYRDMNTFDDIGEVVRNDVIANVILYYQYDHFAKDGANATAVEISTNAEETESSKYGTPTKTAVALFSSSYKYIFELLGVDDSAEGSSEQSPLHVLGKNALDWLVKGIPLDCDEEILNLMKSADDLYDSTDWLTKRWDAIRFKMSGNSAKALEAEKEALTLAREEKLPKWIIIDILIDCRNIEVDACNKKREWVIDSDIQRELKEQETIAYLPILDRYSAEIYDALAEEEFKYKTASPNTMFFGSKFGVVINNVENYFFAAMLYGSYTHMANTRRILARVLYKYVELTQTHPLLLDCIKMLVVIGDEKQFKKTIDYKWDDAYAEIVAHADEIWALTYNSDPSSKEAIKQAVITKLGLYLTDSKFEEVEKFLEELAPMVYWGNSENYFESISQNMCRLSGAKVMLMLTGIIKEECFHLGRKLSNIILQLKLDGIEEEVQRDFCNALKEKISFIVENGGTPQIIASLASQNPEIFSVLSTIPKNGLTGIEKVFYDINMGEGNWNEVLAHEIETARKQFEINKNPGSYTEFFELPYATIKDIMRNHYAPSMNEMVEMQFFPLCIEVLNSKAVAKVKNDCLDCLCDILAFNVELKAKMPQELTNAIAAIEVAKTATILGGPKGAFACRTLMVKIISGAGNKEELLEWCVGYSKKETNERIALVECIEQFIIQGLSNGQIDVTILSIVMQCFEDEHYVVRRQACNCFVLLLDTKYKDLATRKLYEAAIDPSHYVRSRIKSLCKRKKIKQPEIRDQLLGILANDANYAIRVGCNK